ncbi:nuclear transport factor 2 family protein [Hymenobacter sp. RP-2-7]|uniref:Nuclear transport factor 2 family protein n=1 Tax=Hymenobacter polaris TaxID=2682546 RepID=A0A7Y0AIG9_9BACT|nr:nuclear transport factor 2 family protein [Hymenobacter polaris]
MQNEAQLATWNAYQAAWAGSSAAEREQLLARSVADDATYADPTTECQGRTALMAHIEQSQQQRPGATFQNDKFLVHHDQALSWWTMRGVDGATLATGTSYARFGDDGRLTQMTGFFNSAPAGNQ